MSIKPLIASLVLSAGCILCLNATAQAQSFGYFAPSPCANGNCSGYQPSYYAPAYTSSVPPYYSSCPNGNCALGSCPNGMCTTGNCPNGLCPNGKCNTGMCTTGNCANGMCNRSFAPVNPAYGAPSASRSTYRTNRDNNVAAWANRVDNSPFYP